MTHSDQTPSSIPSPEWHPATMNVSRVTVTGDQHPGDPIHESVGFSHTTGQIRET
jgi:hypothetical protein